MGAPKAFKDCPHCGTRVKRERYESHVKKVHGGPEEKQKLASSSHRAATQNRSNRKAKKVVFFAIVCVAVVILASIAIYVWTQRESGGVSSNSQEESKDYTEHRISTPQGWAMWGRCYVSSKDAPLVVLIHGLNTDQSSWNLLLSPLRKEGYNVLALDLPGHGMSKMCNGSYKSVSDSTLSAMDYEEMPSDVSAMVFRAAADTGISQDRVIVVGASIGANIGIIYGAEDSRVDAMVLLSPIKQFVNDLPESHASEIGDRPVMIMVSTSDSNSINTAHTLDDTYTNSDLYPYTAAFHGTDMLKGVADSVPEIMTWLGSNAPV